MYVFLNKNGNVPATITWSKIIAFNTRRLLAATVWARADQGCCCWDRVIASFLEWSIIWHFFGSPLVVPVWLKHNWLDYEATKRPVASAVWGQMSGIVRSRNQLQNQLAAVIHCCHCVLTTRLHNRVTRGSRGQWWQWHGLCRIHLHRGRERPSG